MIFNGTFEPWDPEELHQSKLVFIGKNLDAAQLRADFANCLATPENLQKKLERLRYKVGDRVECNMGGGEWKAGTIMQLMWRDDDMDQGQVCPYKIALEGGGITWAPADEPDIIRTIAAGGKGASKKRKVGGPA